MRKKITAIVSIFLFFMLSKGCISDYIKGGDKDAIANYEKILSENSKATAVLKPEYREVTLKIMGVKTKSYEFKYTFTVNGKNYEGEHTFSTLPSIPIVNIYYLSANPTINCVDPAGKLAIEKRKNTSNEPLYWGIGWGILCLLSLIGFISEIRAQKAEPQPEPA